MEIKIELIQDRITRVSKLITLDYVNLILIQVISIISKVEDDTRACFVSPRNQQSQQSVNQCKKTVRTIRYRELG